MPLRSINGRVAARKDASGFQDRAARLRNGRTAASLLREVSPSATHVTVCLRFVADQGPAHADQSFVLYPGARAYFGFPCPYGDCDGIYDLTHPAELALRHTAAQATGTLECGGARSRHRVPRQPCGLQVNYTVTVERTLAHPATLPLRGDG